MFRSNFQEDKVAGGDFTKLQAVFSKLSGVLPRAEDLSNSNSKVMSSNIIESVLADAPVPVATSKSIFPHKITVKCIESSLMCKYDFTTPEIELSMK